MSRKAKVLSGLASTTTGPLAYVVRNGGGRDSGPPRSPKWAGLDAEVPGESNTLHPEVADG